MIYFVTVQSNKDLPIEDRLAGRSSYFFRSKENAKSAQKQQNARIEKLGIKTRYWLDQCERNFVGDEAIRDLKIVLRRHSRLALNA